MNSVLLLRRLSYHCLLSLFQCFTFLFCRLVNSMKLELLLVKCAEIGSKNLLAGLDMTLGSHGENSLSVCPK